MSWLRHSSGTPVWWTVLSTIPTTCLFISASKADVLQLQGGYTIDAEIVEEKPDSLRVKTVHGTYDIEKSRILRRESSAASWRLYEAEKRKAPDTPEGQYKLAAWCGEHQLRAEQLKHLRRVIELYPDHARARADLGYVRQGDQWIKQRSLKAPSDEERELRRRLRESEARVRRLVSGWFVKVRAIDEGRLKRFAAQPQSREYVDGRRQILAIEDPFALPALTGVLGQGGVPVRLLLVEVLRRFRQDEGTMNLLVLALLDPSSEVRAAAGQELVRRKDARLVAMLRGALFSDQDATVRHAACVLGLMKERSAVEDLIAVLVTQGERVMLVAEPIFLDTVLYTYGRPTDYFYDDDPIWYQPAAIGVIGSTYPMGTLTRSGPQVVDVYRTEVQEALIAITGENFGFDHGAWFAWWERNR